MKYLFVYHLYNHGLLALVSAVGEKPSTKVMTLSASILEIGKVEQVHQLSTDLGCESGSKLLQITETELERWIDSGAEPWMSFDWQTLPESARDVDS